MESSKNITIENSLITKQVSNSDIELISPTKKAPELLEAPAFLERTISDTSLTFIEDANTQATEKPSSSQFVVVYQKFGLIIQGRAPVRDFFIWTRKNANSTHEGFTRTINLTREQIQTIGSQLNLCLFLDALELESSPESEEVVTIRMCCSPANTKISKAQWVDLGKLDSQNKSVFSSIPIGFIMNSPSTSYQLSFYLRKDRVQRNKVE